MAKLRSRKNLHSEIGQRIMYNWVAMVLEGIKRTEFEDWASPLKIESLIHRTVLTGQYGYSALENLGNLKVDKKINNPNYRSKFISNVCGFRRSIYTNPTKRFLASCRIELVPLKAVEVKEYKKALNDLLQYLPELRVSVVEYAIDQYCKGPNEVAKLFDLETHYLWVPYQKQVRLSGENLAEWDNGGLRMSYVSKMKGDVLEVKVYERGADGKRSDDGWRKDTFDRVRVELTVKRPKLKKHGIDTLYDLIENPKFYELNKNTYNFREFRGSDRLPKPWEAYPCEDENGNPGAFQTEYLQAKPKIRNILQYVKDTEQLTELKNTLRESMKDFDREWEAA